jgi:hypothetical protein
MISRTPRKIAHFARRIGGQSSCGNTFRGTASMDLGIFRGALNLIELPINLFWLVFCPAVWLS